MGEPWGEGKSELDSGKGNETEQKGEEPLCIKRGN